MVVSSYKLTLIVVWSFACLKFSSIPMRCCAGYVVHPRSDVLPVGPGSAKASLAILLKQLHSVGMPTWEDIADLSRRRVTT